MEKLLVLVTGATGKTGSEVVAELRARGFPVRSTVLCKDERSARFAGSAGLSAELVVGDLYDFGEVVKAQQGAERAYFQNPRSARHDPSRARLRCGDADQRSQDHRSDQPVARQPGASLHPHARQLWQVEKLFAQLADVAHTLINPAFSPTASCK